MKNWTFSGIRTAIDVFKNRMPGALAMLKAEDISITTHSNSKGEHWNTITFYFGRDGKSAGNAYRAVERLYEMNEQAGAPVVTPDKAR